MDQLSPEVVLAFFTALAASSGFWLFITKKMEGNDAKSKLLMGLAHDRIMYLSGKYLEKKWLTQEEYENLHEYLYVPYIAMGGNGTAKRLMDAVDKLPICKNKEDYDDHIKSYVR